MSDWRRIGTVGLVSAFSVGILVLMRCSKSQPDRAARAATPTVTPYSVSFESNGTVRVDSVERGFELKTVSIERGLGGVTEDPVASVTKQWARRTWTDCVEQLSRSSYGIEQEWLFESRPRGIGPLRVELEFGGQEFVAETNSGLHFRSSDGVAGTRYGRPFWIDAQGQATPLELKHSDGRIWILVPEPLLTNSTYPARLDPTISPEFGIDQLAFTPVAYGDDLRPTVAFDGANYLVVWLEQPPNQPASATRDLVATRVSPAGAILDPTPIEIAHTTQVRDFPSVTSGGGVFLVGWLEGGNAIRVARLSSNGTVLDPTGVTLNTVAGPLAAGPKAAFSTGEFLVAWAEGVSYQALKFKRIDPAGAQLDPVPRAVPYNIGSATYAVAGSGTQFLIAWDGFDVVRAARFSIAGAVLDTPSLAVSNDRGTVTATSDGTDFVVVSSRGSPNAGQVVASRISAAGSVLDSSPIVLAASPAPNPPPHASAVGFDGTDYVVSWFEAGPLAARLSTSGAVLDMPAIALTPAVPPNTYAAESAIACATTNCLTTWRAGSPFVSQGVRISASGVVLDSPPLQFEFTPIQQELPLASFTGSHFIVAWHDGRGGTWAEGLDADAGMLDDAGFHVGALMPWALASNSTQSLVVGTSQQDAPLAIRFANDGTVKDQTPLALAPGTSAAYPYAFAAAAAGEDFIVLWMVNNGQLRIARVLGDGGLPDPNGRVVASSVTAPAIACTNANCVIAWTDPQHLPGLRGSRVDFSANVLDPGGVDLTGNGANQSGPRLATDGTNYMVGSYGNGLQVRRFTPQLTFIDPASLVADGQCGQPEVSFDGTFWMITCLSIFNRDLHVSRMAPDGGLLSPLSLGARPYYSHSVASDQAGHTLIVYPLDDLRTRSRVFGRFIDSRPAPSGAPCVISGDCLSGFCVDSVCCPSACTLDGGADCLACSVAAGSSADGVCSMASSATQCRPAAGPCDRTELCDGLSTSCPADDLIDAGVVCRGPDYGVCDQVERCDGVTSTCPANLAVPLGTPCVQYDTGCNATSACSGFYCPPGPLLDAGTVCHQGLCAAWGVCNPGGSCDPSPGTCAPTTECQSAACIPATGKCEVTAFPNGQPCDGGQCQLGVCLQRPRPDAGILDAGTLLDGGADAGVYPDAGNSTTDAGVRVCDAANCTGCCELNGVCRGGNTDAKCGKGGESCATCLAPAACLHQRCGQQLDGGNAGLDGGTVSTRGTITLCGCASGSENLGGLLMLAWFTRALFSRGRSRTGSRCD